MLLPDAIIQALEQYSSNLININQLYAQCREAVGKPTFEGTRSCWENMKSRCKNGYACLSPEFKTLPGFIGHMGFRPFSDASIHRKDNDQGYTPENCEWTDKKTQSRVRNNTVTLTNNGVTLPLVEWAEKLEITPSVLRQRQKRGWTDEEIINGKRIIHMNPLLNSLPTNFWSYSPWPKGEELNFESQYQKDRNRGEHRLNFYLRYTQKRLRSLNEQLERLAIPEVEYLDNPALTPTAQEQQAIQDIKDKLDKWQAYYWDAQNKLRQCDQDNKPRFYTVSEYMEDKLRKLVSQHVAHLKANKGT